MMVSWSLISRRKQRNTDPWGRVEARFVDGSTVRLAYRGADAPEWEALRCTYAYTITQPEKPRRVAAGEIRSGVGEGVDFTRALRSLVSFLSADAERYRYARFHGRTHPDGEPLDAVHEWAARHTDELDQLTLELDDALARAERR